MVRAPLFRRSTGAQIPGVQTLRTLEDANAILAAVAQPINVVCIGGERLGLEVAGAIPRRGAKVTVVESWLGCSRVN